MHVTHIPRRRLATAASIALVTTMAFIPGARAGTPPAGTPLGTRSPVSWSAPTAIVESTGNLYWTENIIHHSGTSSSTVYRTSKFAHPGDETVVYQVLHNDSYLFGDITYAKVGNDWAFYVVVNIPVLAGSEILRLPFGGAPATTMATSPAYIGSRDLDTDGANLYWVDSGGLRKVGLNGGTVQTLTTGTQLSKIGGVDSTYIYYSSGVSVRRIAKTGGSSALVAPATTAVTALYLRLGSPEFVFWGESDGSISARQVGGSTTEPIQDPQQGRTATSVAADPTLVFWTDCNTSGTQCRTVECKAGTPIVIESDQTDAFDLHTDAHAMFWSSSSGLIRYTF